MTFYFILFHICIFLHQGPLINKQTNKIGFSWKNSSIHFFYFDLNPEGVTGRKTKTKIILKIIDGFRIKDWLLTCDEKIFYLYDLCFPCTTVPLESVLQPFTVVFVSE